MLPRKRSAVWALLTTLLLVQNTEQYSSGAPQGACVDQLPRHSDIQPQSSAPPYVIVTSSPRVRQGDVIDVTVGSPAGAPMPIGGFILQAREIQNPDKTLGHFVSAPARSKLTTCGSANDTATHTSPEDKPALTFQWEAPRDFLGSFEFRATVAQSYDTFWRGVESPLVEVVTRDTVVPPGNTTRPGSSTTTQPPPVIMEAKPKPAAAYVDIIYQGCADTKLCYGIPSGCIEKGDCRAALAVFVAGDVYTFEMQATGNPKYVASGLSFDNKMGDDSAMECVNNNGRVNLYTSWTYPKVEPYVSRSESPQDIVRLLQSSTADGKLYCKFTRDAVSVVKGNTYNLAEGKYNLMILSGDSMKDADRVGFHSLAFESTDSPLALSVVGAAAGASRLLLKLHGGAMLAAWLGTASLGLLLARYFKQTWVGKQFGGKDIWFAWHRILMVLTWLLTMAGFIVIVVEVGGYTTTGDNPHAITGLVTVILCFIQPIGAYFRPHPGTSKRPLFNWMHWFLGNSAHILGIATIFLSVYLQKADLPPWTVFILAAFVAFHIVMHVILSLTVCIADGRISNGRVNSFPMKDMLGQRHATPVDRTGDAPFSAFRKLLFGVYTALILLFTIAMICLVALAPIVQTYNNIMGA